MRLFYYGFRRALPLWVATTLPLLGLLFWVPESTDAGELLGLVGLIDPADQTRARLWSIFGLSGLVLATWRAAQLGNRLTGRDQSWLAPQPARRSVVVGSLILGMTISLAGFAALSAIVVEAGTDGAPGQQLISTPKGPEILRIAAEPIPQRTVTWRLNPNDKWPPSTRLELLVRPLSGAGRSARLTLRLGNIEKHFKVGSARRISIPLTATSLELEHGPSGPPLAVFPGDSRMIKAVSSNRKASLVLGLTTWLVWLNAAGLALGFGTRLAPGLAALSSLTMLLVSGSAGNLDALGARAWLTAFSNLERGWIAPWPSTSVWVAPFVMLLCGGVLVARSIGAATRSDTT